ncbi:HEAT repeat domain-containing protein [Cellulomonas sp.]|uniref:HEAT repeat domain-containing protein n=1 Tax=Cellulomonas sp. TaxID=40001 RepID=UPI001B2B50FB|nr:HEAT repeat domain-containing protein [Cellulomonas sp.]MBO9555979.1 HEAT repeat domain-containing protein [Cellulomonas sp.]
MNPSDLPLDALVAAALDEVRDDHADAPWPHVVELQSRATDQVLDLALAWSVDHDPDVRDLGILVLRELGPADDAGRRPFSDRVVPHLLALLDREDDPATERSLLAALALNGATEALDEFLRRLDHPDDGVRVTVAFQLPYLTDPDAPAAEVIDALEHLTHDADGEVRHFALYALVAEDGFVVDPARALRVARSLAEDPDPQVREMARAHSGERIATPLGPLVLSVTCGDVLGMPSATSLLPSGARTARWDSGDLVVDALVVPYTWENDVLGHPRCTCWGVEWRLHARADTAPITVSALLPEVLEGSPDGDERLATTGFEDDGYVLAIGGPDDQAFAEGVEAGLQPPSWRGLVDWDGPFGVTWVANGLTWQLPALLRDESAATHVAVAWTPSGHEKADDAVSGWAVDVTRSYLRARAGVPSGSSIGAPRRRRR